MDLPTLVLELDKRLQDMERRMNHVVLPGRIVEVDTKKALCKVAYSLDENDEDVVSGWIPWATSRAGEINKWEPPSKDEQVVMLNLSGEIGPLSVVVASLYSEKYKPPHDKGAEKRTTIRKNNQNNEPDDNLPALISNHKATDKVAEEHISRRDKYKNPQKYVDSTTSQVRTTMKAANGGSKNQITHTAGSSAYDSPGGHRTVNTGKIDYTKSSGTAVAEGSPSYDQAGPNTSDSFAGYEGGVTGGES